MFSSLLLERTQYLVRNRPATLSLDDIARETKLSRAWLKHFVAGNIAGPDVCKVECLYVYLAKKPLNFGDE